MNNNININYNNAVWTLIDKLTQKSGLTELVINGPSEVFVEKDGAFLALDVTLSKESLSDFISEVSIYNKKDCDENNPLFDGTLPDGSRINIVMSPLRKEGPAITIRRFSKQLQTFASKKGIFGLSPDWVEFVTALVKAKLNIVVAGGTGVGKTTFMNLLMQEVDLKERVVTIEDVRELGFKLPNVIRMETATIAGRTFTMRDLVRNSLRMRPDRIIVGEVRGGEVFDLLQVMNTGHDGCLASIHANSPHDCLSRLESLYQLSGYDIPSDALKKQIGSAIDFIIQLQRNRNGQRVVSEIVEVAGVSGGTILSQQVGTLQKNLDYITSTGLVPKCIDRLQKAGLRENLFHDFF